MHLKELLSIRKRYVAQNYHELLYVLFGRGLGVATHGVLIFCKHGRFEGQSVALPSILKKTWACLSANCGARAAFWSLGTGLCLIVGGALARAEPMTCICMGAGRRRRRRSKGFLGTFPMNQVKLEGRAFTPSILSTKPGRRQDWMLLMLLTQSQPVK